MHKITHAFVHKNTCSTNTMKHIFCNNRVHTNYRVNANVHTCLKFDKKWANTKSECLWRYQICTFASIIQWRHFLLSEICILLTVISKSLYSVCSIKVCTNKYTCWFKPTGKHNNDDTHMTSAVTADFYIALNICDTHASVPSVRFMSSSQMYAWPRSFEPVRFLW